MTENMVLVPRKEYAANERLCAKASALVDIVLECMDEHGMFDYAVLRTAMSALYPDEYALRLTELKEASA